MCFVFSKAKRRAFYGKWTESFYSYDACLYDDYVTKSSLSHVDQSTLGTSAEIRLQEPSVSCVIVALYIQLSHAGILYTFSNFYLSILLQYCSQAYEGLQTIPYDILACEMTLICTADSSTWAA